METSQAGAFLISQPCHLSLEAHLKPVWMSLVRLCSAVTGDLLQEVPVSEDLELSSQLFKALQRPFCAVLLLAREPLPLGKSLQELRASSPLEVFVAFQRPTQLHGAELLKASGQGDVSAVRRCLRRFQEPEQLDESGESALWRAAQAGHAPVVELLLEAKADGARCAHGATPLFAAAQAGAMAVVRSLLEAKVD